MVWTVAALVRAVADALAARFVVVVVEGEVSGLSRAASGHCYFALKDPAGSAMLRCAMFRRASALLESPPRDGDRVQVRGRIALYEPRGELQLVVESLQAAGAGAQHEQFLRLKAKLQAEGLFDPTRKRPLPAFPRCVAVITSTAAAALRDVLTALARRTPQVRVLVVPAAVQGAGAPAELARAIGIAGRDGRAELVIVTRGGGSAEDLSAFNDERVVRAIASCPVPVVSGVGHETDATLADFAADLRAPTPTAAAELAAPAAAELQTQLTSLAGRLRRRTATLLETHAQRLDRAQLRLARPAAGLRAHSGRLDVLAERLRAAARRTAEHGGARLETLALRARRAPAALLASRAQQLVALAGRLEALDPRRVLARGYAWLSDGRGAPIAGVGQLAPGDALRAVMVDGEADLRVVGVRPDPPP